MQISSASRGASVNTADYVAKQPLSGSESQYQVTLDSAEKSILKTKNPGFSVSY